MKYYFIFALFILIFSCSKKEPDITPDTTPDISKFIQAGDSSASFYYVNPEPDLIVKGISKDTNSSLCNNGGYFYLDSVQIDLDSDQQMDLQFKFEKVFIEGCSCGPTCDWFPTRNRRFEVKSLSDTYIACKALTRYMSQGNYADTFNLNNPISKNLTWKKGTIYLKLDNFYEGPGHWGWAGNNIVVNKYLAIMKIKSSQDAAYGWVKLEVADHIKIEEFALEK